MRHNTTIAITDKESLCSYIERANVYGPHSRAVKISWCIGIAFVVMICLMFCPADVNWLFAILAAFLALLLFLLCEVGYYQRTVEFSFGLYLLSAGKWEYMELYFNERKSYFFRRIMQSPSFILIAGLYYRLKVGNEDAATKLIELACGRDADLRSVAMVMSSRHGLSPRKQKLLKEKFVSDLGVMWIYRLRRKKWLWAAGVLLLALLCAARNIGIVVDSVMTLINGGVN